MSFNQYNNNNNNYYQRKPQGNFNHNNNNYNSNYNNNYNSYNNVGSYNYKQVSSNHRETVQPRTGSGNQLYMGDLDFSWDETVVKQIWAQLGENNVSVKMMWNNSMNGCSEVEVQPRNQGYCFLEFPSSEHANNALLKNGMAILNFPHKKLRLNWSSSSSTGGHTTGKLPMDGSGGGNNLSLFIGDLTPNTTEAELFELFINRYPSTEHIKVVYDQVTGVSKGYGFVRFGNPEDQQKAMVEMQGAYLNGRAIKLGSTGAKNQQSLSQNRILADGSIDTRQGTHRTGSKPPTAKSSVKKQSQFMLPVQQQPTLNHFTDSNNTTLFITGLPIFTDEDELKEYFQPYGIISYIEKDEVKKCAFVQFLDRISAETALINLQEYPIGNTRMKISWGRPSGFLQNMPAKAEPSFPEEIYNYIPSSILGSQHSSQGTGSNSTRLLPGFNAAYT